jgi:predicted nicotinamide N-methyase
MNTSRPLMGGGGGVVGAGEGAAAAAGALVVVAGGWAACCEDALDANAANSAQSSIRVIVIGLNFWFE